MFESGFGGAPAEDGDNVAFSFVIVDAVDVFGENSMDTAAEEVAGDGVSDFSGDDDSGQVLGESAVGQAAEDEIGATFGIPVFARARKFRVACHAEFPG